MCLFMFNYVFLLQQINVSDENDEQIYFFVAKKQSFGPMNLGTIILKFPFCPTQVLYVVEYFVIFGV
jgi:hypothetical protein